MLWNNASCRPTIIGSLGRLLGGRMRVAALDVFRNLPCKMHKTRSDVSPATVNGVIDIVDRSSVVGAFRG